MRRKGFCDVVLADQVEATSSYIRNTAIIETVLTDSAQGGAVKSHRFRSAVPAVRSAVPAGPARPANRTQVAGLPRITDSGPPDLRLRPPEVTEKRPAARAISVISGGGVCRSGSAPTRPLSYIEHEHQFRSEQYRSPWYLRSGRTIPQRRFESTGREFLEDRTKEYWLNWVALPRPALRVADGGDARSAITLKLCSIRGDRGDHRRAYDLACPEAPGLGAQLGLSLLLGARFLLRRPRAEPAWRHPDDGRLHRLSRPTSRSRTRQPACSPSTASCLGTPLHEWIAPNLNGFKNQQAPVRVGNAAVDPGPARWLRQRSSSAVTQMFVDERLPKMGDESAVSPA